MEVIVALRNVGDGHNASDPAFNQLRANLLEQYEVERVEDLPINFRGIVAQAAEAKLTDVLNEFAERRMASQMAQSSFVNTLEILSPFAVLHGAPSSRARCTASSTPATTRRCGLPRACGQACPGPASACRPTWRRARQRPPRRRTARR